MDESLADVAAHDPQQAATAFGTKGVCWVGEDRARSMSIRSPQASEAPGAQMGDRELEPRLSPLRTDSRNAVAIEALRDRGIEAPA